MIREVALGDAEAIFAIHVTPILSNGTIESSLGSILVGSGIFEAVIEGKGRHASMTHITTDPIVATSFAILSLEQIASRETDPLNSLVVSVKFMDGGIGFNIIQSKVRFGGSFRSLTSDELDVEIL